MSDVVGCDDCNASSLGEVVQMLTGEIEENLLCDTHDKEMLEEAKQYMEEKYE